MNLQGLIFKKIEHRIIAGTVAFLAMMAIIGWIAINEPGRMASFEAQYNARAIERGATLFASNCSPCHGVDGRGTVGRAPALNSPYLFGHDYYGAIDQETDNLNAELASPDITEERRTEIQARLTELQTERATLQQQLSSITAPGTYDPEAPSRLTNLGWGSTLYNFIYTTLVHGRPNSSSYWPQPMASWIQTGGGPLRVDDGQDITAYILNWDKGEDWTVDDLLAVRQFPIRPVDPAIAQSSGGAETVGTDVAAILAELPNFQGDPVAGQALYQGAYACFGCHGNATVAPLVDGTFTRVQDIRLQDPAVTALLPEVSPEAYFVFSIVLPHDYLVPPYGPVMPATFGSQLSYQNLADLIAYLETQDQPIQ